METGHLPASSRLQMQVATIQATPGIEAGSEGGWQELAVVGLLEIEGSGGGAGVAGVVARAGMAAAGASNQTWHARMITRGHVARTN